MPKRAKPKPDTRKQPPLDPEIVLSPRQALFCAEYLKDFNATQAAIRAGYSKQSAHVEGSRLLANADIDRIVRGKLAAQLAELEASPDRILLELTRIAFANPGRKPVEQWTEAELASIVGIEYLVKNAKAGDGVTDEVLKVRRESKTKALELLAKIRGMLVDKVEHSGVVEVVSGRLEAARKRLAERKG